MVDKQKNYIIVHPLKLMHEYSAPKGRSKPEAEKTTREAFDEEDIVGGTGMNSTILLKVLG